MIQKIFLILLISSIGIYFSFFNFIVSGQGTSLDEGSAFFDLRPISLLDVPIEYGDYCVNPDGIEVQNTKLGLSTSDENYLNIKWNAIDKDGIENKIGVECWLNCQGTANDIINSTAEVNHCDNQNLGKCNFIGSTGTNFCTIINPNYTISDNEVKCRFYDQVDKNTGVHIETRNFKIIDYEIIIPTPVLTVGAHKTISLPVKSFGLLGTNFTNNITAFEKSHLVSIFRPRSITEVAYCGDVVESYPSINFLSTGKISFYIETHATQDNKLCILDNDCSYINTQNQFIESKCINNACWSRTSLSIEAGEASLPEYNFIGFLFIILFSSIVFYFKTKKF